MIDVVIKIKAGDYETKIPYEYEIVPIDEDTMTVREAREHTDRQKEMKKNHLALRRQDIYRLTVEFRKDLADEYGVTGHPKEPKLWNMAWEHGHSSGLEEVAMYYDELVELVK